MRALIGLASIVVIVAGLRATSGILIPLVLAVFFALLSFPLVRMLQRLGVHAMLAVAATVVVVLTALVVPGMLVVAAVRQFVSAVPGYEMRLRLLMAQGFEWLQERNLNIDTTAMIGLADPARALEIIVTTLSGVVTLLSIVFLVVIIAAFVLLEAAGLFERPHGIVNAGQRQQIARFVGELQIYLWVKTGVSLATGVAAGGWVALLGVDFALLWGLLAFLLNYIPTFGSLVAAMPPALLALIQFGPWSAVLVLIGYVAINIVFGTIVEPQLMGRQLRLSPLVVLIAVITWGWIWGIAGMLLSVPITMAIKLALEQSDETRWFAELLEGGRQGRREAHAPRSGEVRPGPVRSEVR